AKFDKKKFKLTLSESGNGTGTVSSSPAGINCPGECEKEFEEGKVVTLTATPTVPGSQFGGWNNCPSPTGTECTVTMSAAKTVEAAFVVPAPTAANEPEEEVSQTSAALVGKVNNNGALAGTACSFQVTLASDPGFSSPVKTPDCTQKTIS